MPSELDNPITIVTGAPVETSQISIKELAIVPPGGPENPGFVRLVIAQGDGVTSHRIPGTFRLVDDVFATSEVIGGKVFEVAPGNYYSDACSAAPVGASNLEAIKAACYAALAARYPALSGSVS